MSEIKHTRVPDPNDQFRGMYDGEPWAAVAKRAGLEPHNAESQARMVAASAADEIAELLEALTAAREHLKWSTPQGQNAMVQIVNAIAKAEGR